MGVIINKVTGLPTNNSFNIEEYLKFKLERTDDTGLFIWSDEQIDHMRLPGNISIFDVLVYTELLLEKWYPIVGYSGDNIMYSPAFPDIIYSSQTVSSKTPDSPHPKVPPIIAYRIIRREPTGSGKYPFKGPKKMWKHRRAGFFRDENDVVREVRSKFWETEVEFICIHRSGGEAEALCVSFEDFIERNEGRYLEAGIVKMTLLGRKPEPIFSLDQVGIHYRAARVWFKTQEFQISIPITEITSVEVDLSINTDQETTSKMEVQE